MDKIKFYLLAVISVIAALLGVYGYAKKAGEHAEQKKHQAKVNKSIKKAREVENEANSTDIDSVRKRMRDNWTRS